MEKINYICDGTTFSYATGYIALPVVLGNLPDMVVIEENTLLKKSSFHVSLLCVKDVLEKDAMLENEILERFCAYIKNNDVSLVRLNDEFRFAQKNERKSLIVRCEISNLQGFFIELSEQFGFTIPLQPTHITLYTLQPNAGIGLNSPEAMERNSLKVSAPNDLRVALGLA